MLVIIKFHWKYIMGGTRVEILFGEASSAAEGCMRDFDQCDQTKNGLQLTAPCHCCTEAFHALHAFLRRDDGVVSRIANSKDPSGEDGEGEESVQGVVAQELLLPASDGLSLIFTVGILSNQEKKKNTMLV